MLASGTVAPASTRLLPLVLAHVHTLALKTSAQAPFTSTSGSVRTESWLSEERMVASILAWVWDASLLSALTKASNAPDEANPRARTIRLRSRTDPGCCERIDCSILLEQRCPSWARWLGVGRVCRGQAGGVGDTGRYRECQADVQNGKKDDCVRQSKRSAVLERWKGACHPLRQTP